LTTVYDILVSSAETSGVFNTGFGTVNCQPAPPYLRRLLGRGVIAHVAGGTQRLAQRLLALALAPAGGRQPLALDIAALRTDVRGLQAMEQRSHQLNVLIFLFGVRTQGK